MRQRVDEDEDDKRICRRTHQTLFNFIAKFQVSTSASININKIQIPMQSSPILILFILILTVTDLSSSSFMADPIANTVVDDATQPLDPNASAVHIVYTEKPRGNEEPESYHIRTLTSVLRSEEAARDALIYSYKNAASGFSAKLTPEQVDQISAQPGVLQVVPSTTYQLHSGPGRV